ncbi:hypothetical protein M404DRAFT_998646 [Pisolithus tinctorius Marx 270]|uniref:Uncharacterized protein n=1 Tax=Pisolithus tinctorius Marx 270 TaxID=870435 RepID=A0A0C3JDT8_PISTI|nr:hypothetical protein M404DRAFT_998646 [Pisolithus tinctorius Marx 270]
MHEKGMPFDHHREQVETNAGSPSLQPVWNIYHIELVASRFYICTWDPSETVHGTKEAAMRVVLYYDPTELGLSLGHTCDQERADKLRAIRPSSSFLENHIDNRSKSVEYYNETRE